MSNKTQKPKDGANSTNNPAGVKVVKSLSELNQVKLIGTSVPKPFYIPTPLTDTEVIEGGERCNVADNEWPDEKQLEASWGYRVGSIDGLVNVHLLCNSALPVDISVVGIIEQMQDFTVNDKVIVRHGFPYKTRSECRFPGFFRLSAVPEKGLVSVTPAINSERHNPWWVVSEYINKIRRELGREDITLQDLRESIDECLRGKTKQAYPPLWQFEFDKNGILSGKTKWYNQKRAGLRYVNVVSPHNKRLEGIHRIFETYNVILWEKF